VIFGMNLSLLLLLIIASLRQISLSIEIKDAALSSYAKGAPGPDGLSFWFY
jgi:hypothetical protein